jgi:hypothetical protein
MYDLCACYIVSRAALWAAFYPILNLAERELAEDFRILAHHLGNCLEVWKSFWLIAV